MKKKKRVSYPGIQMGTSYLLVIFVILCLVTFATLSLSGAKRDQTYSLQLADRETAYCEANSKAAKMMAQIDDALQTQNPEFAIQQIEGVTVEKDRGNLEISYTVPVTDSQNLEVAIQADPANGTQKVVKWKESASTKWKEKSTLPVIGSD